MSLPGETINIDTPENVSFDYDIAGIGSRFMAAIVDTILIIILQIVVLILVGWGLRSWISDTIADTTFNWYLAITGLIAFALFWGYFIFFEMLWNGQSPGKRRVNLRVVRTNGMPVTLVESIIRNLVRLVDFLPIFYGAGVVTMFLNQRSQRLGDLAAGTLVVRERTKEVTLANLAADSSARTLAAKIRSGDPVAVNLPIERLSAQDIELAENFLLRKYKLANRTTLAKHILTTLFEKMDVPMKEIDAPEAEDLLEAIVGNKQSAGK